MNPDEGSQNVKILLVHFLRMLRHRPIKLFLPGRELIQGVWSGSMPQNTGDMGCCKAVTGAGQVLLVVPGNFFIYPRAPNSTGGEGL
jgi:hypothetical protein